MYRWEDRCLPPGSESVVSAHGLGQGLGAESAMSTPGLGQVMPRKTSTFQASVSHSPGLGWSILCILVIFVSYI